MNVSCSNCPAKYAIPDAKIRGKKVRLSCRRCGSAIIVDGTHLGDDAGDEATHHQEQPTGEAGTLGSSPPTAPTDGAVSPPSSSPAGTGSSAEVSTGAAPSPTSTVEVDNSGREGVPVAAGLARTATPARAGAQFLAAQTAQTPRRQQAAKRTMMGGLEAPTQPLSTTRLGTPQVTVSSKAISPGVSDSEATREAQDWDTSVAGSSSAAPEGAAQTKPAQPTGTSQPSDNVRTVEPPTPGEAAKAADAARPADTAKVAIVAKPIEATKLTEAVTPTEASKLADTAKPAETTKLADTAKAAEISKLADTAKPSEATKLADPAKLVEPSKPTLAVKPAEGSRPAEVTKSAEAVRPTEIAKSADAAKPVEAVKSTETTKIADIAKPAEAVKTSELSKGAEPASTKPGQAPSQAGPEPRQPTSEPPLPGSVEDSEASEDGKTPVPVAPEEKETRPATTAVTTSEPRLGVSPKEPSPPSGAKPSDPRVDAEERGSSTPSQSAVPTGPGVVAIAKITPVRIAAPSSPRTKLPLPKLADKDITGWVVAVNDRDHTEMSTRQVVELYAIGAVTARTLVWGKGLDRWHTPFEIQEICDALGARGFRKPTTSDSVPVARPDPSNLADEPLADSQAEAPVSEPKGWREPGKFVTADRTAPARAAPPRVSRPNPPDSDDDVNFDEVTVAVDARKLLQQADVTVRANMPPYEDRDTPAPNRVVNVIDPAKPPHRLDRGGLDDLGAEEPTVHVRDQKEVERLLRSQQNRGADLSPESVAYERSTTGDMLAGLGGDRSGDAARSPADTRTQETERRRVQLASTPQEAERSTLSRIALGALLMVLVPLAAMAGVYAYDPELLAETFPALRETFPHYFPPPLAPAPELPSAEAPANPGPPQAGTVEPARETAEPGTAPKPQLSAEITGTGAAPAAISATPPPGARGAAPKPFDRPAAQAALGVAAGGSKACAADPDGGQLEGTVVVTFEPSGRVSLVDVTGSLRGTPAGLCVDKLFRKLRVDPFDGTAMVMARQVSIP